MNLEDLRKQFTPNYAPAPFVLSHGAGCYLYDQDGQKYLDFSSGIAVNNLGHCHPKIVAAIQDQSTKLLHSSNLFWNAPAAQLAEKIIAHSFADRVFLCNSGTEANEAALKLSRKFFYDQGKPRPHFVSFEGGFHGRSMGSLSVTAKEAYRKPFEPLVPGCRFGKWNDSSSLEFIDETVAAVIFEPVQGESGVRPIDPEFAKALAQRCKETGSLLIADCIQVGFYRIGELFGYESLGFEPDLLTTAKALGGGLPIGALLLKEQVAQSMQVGSHGTTFGGNPMACRAAIAILDVLTNSNEQSKFRANAEIFFSELLRRFKDHPKVKEIRGRFMMAGIELHDEVTPVFLKLRQQKVLVTQIKPKCLRVLPPLIAEAEDCRAFFDALDQALHE